MPTLTVNPSESSVFVNPGQTQTFNLADLFVFDPGGAPIIGAQMEFLPTNGLLYDGQTPNINNHYGYAVFGDQSGFDATTLVSTITFTNNTSIPIAASAIATAGFFLAGPAGLEYSYLDSNNKVAFAAGPVIGAPAPNTLFTIGTDNVDFNNLNSNQIAEINAAPDQLYNALGGDDTVTLPNKDANGNYVLPSSTNATWDPTHTFTVGALTDSSTVADTITGGDGDYNITVVGPAAVSITITGDGNETITAGSGNDTITITGAGNSKVVGNLTGTASISGGGTLDLTGTFNGSATIGYAVTLPGPKIIGSTLELGGASAGGLIQFVAGGNETLKIDGTTMPTNVINGLSPGDTIDLATVKFDKAADVTLFSTDNLLDFLKMELTISCSLIRAIEPQIISLCHQTDLVEPILLCQQLLSPPCKISRISQMMPME
jgi:hypothetical protein